MISDARCKLAECTPASNSCNAKALKIQRLEKLISRRSLSEEVDPHRHRVNRHSSIPKS
jgi:hypothetical protein